MGLSSKYLLHDRDKIYGDAFQKRIRNMRLEEVLIAPRSSWQNPFVERIGRVVSNHLDYYHPLRTHLSLEMGCPEHREVQEVSRGGVIEVSEVGDLRHRYERRAA